jgi:hypothetical protein
MLRAILAAATLALVSPATAEECRPADRVVGILHTMNASHAIYDGDAVARAARIYAAMPPAGTAPAADHLLIADLPSGSMMLLLLRGPQVCATLMVPDPRTARIAKQFILGIET